MRSYFGWMSPIIDFYISYSWELEMVCVSFVKCLYALQLAPSLVPSALASVICFVSTCANDVLFRFRRLSWSRMMWMTEMLLLIDVLLQEYLLISIERESEREIQCMLRKRGIYVMSCVYQKG